MNFLKGPRDVLFIDKKGRSASFTLIDEIYLKREIIFSHCARHDTTIVFFNIKGWKNNQL